MTPQEERSTYSFTKEAHVLHAIGKEAFIRADFFCPSFLVELSAAVLVFYVWSGNAWNWSPVWFFAFFQELPRYTVRKPRGDVILRGDDEQKRGNSYPNVPPDSVRFLPRITKRFSHGTYRFVIKHDVAGVERSEIVGGIQGEEYFRTPIILSCGTDNSRERRRTPRDELRFF
ncbi:MAG TPA: hypothetical protein VEI57_15170 [Nitrospirota bacterium]|nr:hypothetical protein [Nitrospirota bacterium]